MRPGCKRSERRGAIERRKVVIIMQNARADSRPSARREGWRRNTATGIVTEAGESLESAPQPQTEPTAPNPHVKFPGPITFLLQQ